MKQYELEYRGIQLRIEINDMMISSLYINGIHRDSGSPSLTGYCGLSSSVQTDYEWHEFIKADIVINESEVIIRLSANNEALGAESFTLDTAS